MIELSNNKKNCANDLKDHKVRRFQNKHISELRSQNLPSHAKKSMKMSEKLKKYVSYSPVL